MSCGGLSADDAWRTGGTAGQHRRGPHGRRAAGLLSIVAGEPFGQAMRQTYYWGDTAEEVWDLTRWPLGLGALVCAVTGLFRYCPRRRQPGLSWLAVGGVLTVVTWLGVSGLLALYVVVQVG